MSTPIGLLHDQRSAIVPITNTTAITINPKRIGFILMSSLFTAQAPATPAADDDTSYELGMKFMVAKAGVISPGEPTIARGILSFRRSRL